jgi:hypothetical protein
MTYKIEVAGQWNQDHSVAYFKLTSLDGGSLTPQNIIDALSDYLITTPDDFTYDETNFHS